MGRYHPTITLKKRDDVHIPLPQQNKAGVVLQINFGHIEVVPIWVALHGHKVKHIYVYSALASPECLTFSGIHIKCITNDIQGIQQYLSVAHAIDSLAQVPTDVEVEGLIFLHPDVIWSSIVSLDGPLSYDVDAQPFPPRGNWSWTNRKCGIPATKVFEIISGRQLKYYNGQADEFYVAKQDFKTFAEVAREMDRAGLYHEIAVSTIFAYLANITTPPKRVGLLTYLDDRRDRYTLNVQEFANMTDRYMFSHPYKLLSLDGLLAHLAC